MPAPQSSRPLLARTLATSAGSRSTTAVSWSNVVSGSPASLDALCRRFAIDLTARQKHGARLDAELLAAVYLELIGGRQPGLEFVGDAAARGAGQRRERAARPPRPHAPSASELERHRAFLAKLKAPLWTASE